MATLVTLDRAWRDLGAAPRVLQLVGDRGAVCTAGREPPTDPLAEATTLSSGARMLVSGHDERVYGRAATTAGGPAAVMVMTPAEYMASPPPVDLNTVVGLALFQLATAGSAWRPVAVAIIAQEGIYQDLFTAGTARAGGYIVNTSPPGTGPIWVDPTGRTGAQRSSGAMPVYPAQDTASAPGGWRVPPSSGAVTIMGPAGATFQAFSA